ncbi:MAG: lytic transglycosylase domain-containing protein [Planctomycetota bacterium]
MERTLISRVTGAAEPASDKPPLGEGERPRRRRWLLWGGLAAALAGSILILYISHRQDVAGLREMVRQVAMEEGIDPLLALAVMHAESRGDPRAVSRARAIGLMQLRLPTASEMAGRQLRESELFDPRLNAHLGCRYLYQLLRRYDGDLRLTLMAYNAGPGNLEKWQRLESDPQVILKKHAFAQTRGYVAKVLLYLRAHRE